MAQQVVLLVMCLHSTLSFVTARVAALTCEGSSEDLHVSWDAVPGADLYDVHVGVPGTERYLRGHHTEGNETSIMIEALIPGKEYWFQLLARVNTPQVHGEWIEVSVKQECSLNVALQSTLRDDQPRRRYLTPRRRGYFIVDMIRHNHGNAKFDGLDNKNAGDAIGQAWLMHTGWHTDSCHMAAYHVHVKEVQIPNQETPVGGRGRFANYMSCNPGGGPGGYHCDRCNGPDCGWFKCNCGRAGNTFYSKDHVGMGTLHHRQDMLDGVWYSCPYAGQQAKNWRRDKDYQTAKCFKGMTAAQIKQALHMSASMFLRAWDADISAFPPEAAGVNQSTTVIAV